MDLDLFNHPVWDMKICIPVVCVKKIPVLPYFIIYFCNKYFCLYKMLILLNMNARSDPDPGLQHKCASNISHSCEISIVRNNEVRENATQNFSTQI